jgi:hypothetical protein
MIALLQGWSYRNLKRIHSDNKIIPFVSDGSNLAVNLTSEPYFDPSLAAFNICVILFFLIFSL